MRERPLSPWRGPEGPLARLRASRNGLAVIAVITIVLIGIVGIAVSVTDRDDPPAAPVETSTDDAAP